MNPFTGEVSFELENAEYVIRPSFGAIAEIEQELNQSIVFLLENIESRGLLIQEQEIIFRYGLKYAERILNKEQVNHIIQKLGIIKSTEICIKFINNILI